MVVVFYGLKFDLPHGWVDITDDLPEGSPPTLAHPNGVGVVQFSVARHRDGENPNVKRADLRRLLDEYSSSRQMRFDQVLNGTGSTLSVQGTSRSNDEVTLVRMLSNGRDVALVTYFCASVHFVGAQEELRVVDRLMDSIVFDAAVINHT